MGQGSARCPFCSAVNAPDDPSCAECGHALRPVGRSLTGLFPLIAGVAIGMAVAAWHPSEPLAPAARQRPPRLAGGLKLPTESLMDAGTEAAQGQELVERARTLLASRKFAQLDELFADVRRNKTRFAAGGYILPELYGGLGDLPAPKSAEGWVALIDSLRAWAKAQPASVSAHTALAHGMLGWGWHARGSGYANTVSKDGWRLLRERLNEGEAACRAAVAADPAAYDPYSIWIRLGMGLGYDTDRVMQLAKDGIAKDRDAFSIHRAVVVFLLPRWHGKKGEWETYAEKTAGTDDMLYARIVTAAANYDKRKFFTEARVSWARVARGMQKLAQQHPTSSVLFSRFAWWAWLAGDRPVAAAVFGRLGDRYEDSIWENRKTYDKVRAWATR